MVVPARWRHPHRRDARAGGIAQLEEECRVTGALHGPTAVTSYGPGDRHFTFLADIGDQEPSLGHDPELIRSGQILHKLAWMRLDEVPALDRVYLWTAGLLAVPGFLEEARRLAGAE